MRPSFVLPLLGVIVLVTSHGTIAHPFLDQRGLDILLRPDNNTIKAFQSFLRGPIFGIFNGGGPFAKVRRFNTLQTAIATNNASASDIPNRPGFLSSLGFAGLFGFGAQASVSAPSGITTTATTTTPTTKTTTKSPDIAVKGDFSESIGGSISLSNDDDEDVGPKVSVTPDSPEEDKEVSSTTTTTTMKTTTTSTVVTGIAAFPPNFEELFDDDEEDSNMDGMIITRLGEESEDKDQVDIMGAITTGKSDSAPSESEDKSDEVKVKNEDSEEIASTTPSESKDITEMVMIAGRIGDDESAKKIIGAIDVRADLDASLLDSVFQEPNNDANEDMKMSETKGGYAYNQAETRSDTKMDETKGGYAYNQPETRSDTKMDETKGGYQYEKSGTDSLIHESKSSDVKGGYQYKKSSSAEFNIRASSPLDDEKNADDKLTISLAGRSFGIKSEDDNDDIDENKVDKKPSDDSDSDPDSEKGLEKRRRNIRTMSQPFVLNGIAVDPQEINNLRYIRQFVVYRS